MSGQQVRLRTCAGGQVLGARWMLVAVDPGRRLPHRTSGRTLEAEA